MKASSLSNPCDYTTQPSLSNLYVQSIHTFFVQSVCSVHPYLLCPICMFSPSVPSLSNLYVQSIHTFFVQSKCSFHPALVYTARLNCVNHEVTWTRISLCFITCFFSAGGHSSLSSYGVSFSDVSFCRAVLGTDDRTDVRCRTLCRRMNCH